MKIAVASGKGGTGKTTVAVALARALGECVFIDCDVEAPNAYLFLRPELEGGGKVHVLIPEADESKCTGCGECSRVCRFNAIAALGTTIVVFPELCHGCRGCLLVCEPGALTEAQRLVGELQWGKAGGIAFYHGRLRIGEPMSPPLIRALKERALENAGSREVILDCPPGTTCPMIEAVRGADYCLLVTEPTPFGMHDLEMALGAVAELSIPAGVVINRADMGDDRVRKFCRDRGAPVLLEIPHERRIAEGYASGRDLIAIAPELKKPLMELLAEVLRRDAA